MHQTSVSAQNSKTISSAKYKKPGIYGIDTRMLTRILRGKGAQNGCLSDKMPNMTEEKAVELARKFPGLKGMDLAKVVTTPEIYTWTEGTWEFRSGLCKQEPYRIQRCSL